MSASESARVPWVDTAKGICIIMVVMVHATLGVEVYAGIEDGVTSPPAGPEDPYAVALGGAAPVVLFCHGNAGNISHRLESIALFHRLGLSVLIFDYRGYGDSEGKPDEQGTYRDARAAWRHLRELRGVAGDDIILFGRSLGAAVAAWLAARERPRAVILESAFTSAASLGAEHYPWLPVDLLLRHRYDTLARVSEIRAPLLVVHSRDDEIVPFHHGRALFDAAAEPKRLLEIRGGHNDGFLASGAVYRDALAAFLAAAGDARKRSTDPIPGRP